MSQDPFSIEEIHFIVAERINLLGQLRNTPEDRRRMVDSVVQGLQFARRSGYVIPLIVAVRTWGSNAEVWSGPASDPSRPAWTLEEARNVTIREA